MTLRESRITLPNGLALPYVERGDTSSTPVLFLHGFADSWHSFEEVLSRLPESIRSLALTQRGHGEADRPQTGYSIVDFASDVEGFMESLDIPSAVLVGHSMGSAVALRFAIDHPDKVKGLVLVGAAPSMKGTEAARKFWDETLAQLKDPIDPAFVGQMTEASLVRPVSQGLLETNVKEGAKMPAFVWREAMSARWRLEGDYEAELGKINTPTLIVWGDHDIRYSRREQESLAAAISGSRLVAYEGVGHMVHWEAAEQFVSDLVDFVERLTRHG